MKGGNPWETESWTAEPIGTIAGYPREGKWNAWVTHQGEVWVNKENQVFLIKDMPPRYCFNVLRFVYLNHFEDLGPNPLRNPLILALAQRLKDHISLSDAILKASEAEEQRALLPW